MHEPVLWGIHAGATGDADKLFLKLNHIGVGWVAMGNMGELPANLDAFKTQVSASYPDAKPGSIPVSAGQAYRFVHVMREGDLAIYPSKVDRRVHVGRITGPYRYDPSLEPGYPNIRPVKWLGNFPRTQFSQGALHEIGSAMSLFQVKNYAEEFLAALEGKASPTPAESDDTVAAVAEDIEETTRDFVLKQLAQELKGHGFAHFVGALLTAMGYRVAVSPPGPDGGIDIVARKDELGVDPAIKVQVKSSEGSIGNSPVSSLSGHLEPQEFGLFVTLGSYTAAARTFARAKSNLRLIDGPELVDLVLAHYDQLDPRYKGILPLKQVWVPVALD